LSTMTHLTHDQTEPRQRQDTHKAHLRHTQRDLLICRVLELLKRRTSVVREGVGEGVRVQTNTVAVQRNRKRTEDMWMQKRRKTCGCKRDMCIRNALGFREHMWIGNTCECKRVRHRQDIKKTCGCKRHGIVA